MDTMKEQLIEDLRKIFGQGWHRSVKKTRDVRNDGAVGNTLEVLLGIEENNLPIPNAREWELKGQRSHTSSLVTLKHIEPSPTAFKIVTRLLTTHGWKHKEAGKEYPLTEMSFRSTTSATGYTSRGFRIVVDRSQQKVRFVFDALKADAANPEIASWLKSVEARVGLGSLNPEPYWGFEDLRYAIGSKIRNCFYVVADSRLQDGRESFLYKELYIMSGFSFERFLGCIDTGVVLIDFDARTSHNHGTKYRMKQGHWTGLYSEVERVV